MINFIEMVKEMNLRGGKKSIVKVKNFTMMKKNK